MEKKEFNRWEIAKPILKKIVFALAPVIFPVFFPIGVILWAQVNGWLPFPTWSKTVTYGLLGAIIIFLLLEEIGVYFLAKSRNASYVTWPAAAFLLSHLVLVKGTGPGLWGVFPIIIFAGLKLILGIKGKVQTGKFGAFNRWLPWSISLDTFLIVRLYGFQLMILILGLPGR